MNKNLVLIYTVILTFIGCQLTTPTVEVKASNEYDVILWKHRESFFWVVSIPFEVKVTNTSFRNREFTYYKFFCEDYFNDNCGIGFLYSEKNGKLIKEGVITDKKIPFKSTKKYILYSRHYVADTLKYPRSLFKEYYHKLQKSGLKDSLPVGKLVEFKQKHPKLVENLLKNDSIYFRFPFPKTDKIKGYAEGVRVPVKW